MINSNINSLNEPARSRVRSLMEDAKIELPNLVVFETKRSEHRQARLYGQGRNKFDMRAAYSGNKYFQLFAKPFLRKITWTTKSKHITGDACDFCFAANGKKTWEGNWYKLRELGKRHKLKSLYPLESAHLEYNYKYDIKINLMEKIIKLSKRLWNLADKLGVDIKKETEEIKKDAHDIANEARKD